MISSTAKPARPQLIHVLIPLSAVVVLLLSTAAFRLFAVERSRGMALLLFLLPLPEMLLLFLIRLHLRAFFARPAGFLIAPLLGILVVWNLGECFYRFLYREHFSLLRDLRHLPGFMAMISGVDLFMDPAGAALLLLVAAGLALAIGLGLLALFKLLTDYPSFGTLRRDSSKRRRTGLVLTAILLVQLLLFPGEVPTLRLIASVGAFFQAPGTPAVSRLEAAKTMHGTDEPVLQPEQTVSYRFPGIRDGDVHLFIVESYGHTLYSNPEHKRAMVPVYTSLQQEIESQGYSIRSGFLRSPAFGGRSWLADATMLTGIQVETQELYDQLPLSGGRNLSHIFEDAGYYRLMAAPGTRQAGEEWRNFYRFSSYLFRYDFEYRGPFVSFGAMPDQYLLYYSGEQLKSIDTPVFALYILVSTHVPFEVIPEYIPDWERLAGGEIYAEGHLREFQNNWLSGSEYPEGFIAGVDYSLRSIVGYIDRYLQDGSLAIIIGDHQPRIPVSERESTYSVPVHFLSRDAELLARLPAEHFDQGLRPEAVSDEHLPMAELPALLLGLVTQEPEH